jgi:hypothetical protein
MRPIILIGTRNKNKIATKKFRVRKVYKSYSGQCIHFCTKLPNEMLALPFAALNFFFIAKAITGLRTV